MRNDWLLVGGILSAVAAALHLGCVFGGPPWYRFFGAGERIARLAERGSVKPALITLFIVCVLAIWSAYAFSGAGVIGPLPFVRPMLVLITAIYLVRAMALPLMLAHMPDRSSTFLVWSSGIVLLSGIVHAIGVVTAWSALG